MNIEDKIVGHVAIRKKLKKLIAADSLPSALLFDGPPGIGKQLVALEVAISLLCEAKAYGGCGSCKACKLFQSRNHADFIPLECSDKEVASVANVRELLYGLNLKAFSGGNRIVLFNDAEKLNLQACNALLKSIEEPRPGTFFLLVSSNRTKLPSTVVSRCHVWSFQPLSDSEVEKYLSTKTQLELGERGELISVCDGSLEGLDTLKDHLSEWREIHDSLGLIAEGNVPLAIEVALELSKKKDELGVIFHFLRVAARRKLRGTADHRRMLQWSLALSNILGAERLIFERNLSPYNVLSLFLVGLAKGGESDPFFEALASETLIETYTV